MSQTIDFARSLDYSLRIVCKIEYQPIGTIRTPFKECEAIPKQPRCGKGRKGTIEIYDKYRAGLTDLDGFSHIVLVFHMHMSSGFELKVVPYQETVARGVFATRSPRRPNQIGLSVVRLEKIEGSILYLSDLDILDGTPLLDIKPYIPEGIDVDNCRLGWLTDRYEKEQKKAMDD